MVLNQYICPWPCFPLPRWCFEIATLMGVMSFFIFQIGNEIKNAGPSTCWR